MRLRVTVLIFIAAIATAARNRSLSLAMPDAMPLKAAASSCAPAVPEVVVDAVKAAVDMKTFTADRLKLVERALGYIGCRYGSGRRGPDRFDCSGFTGYVYEREGIMLGRSSRDQYLEGKAVEAKALQPGDLVFFGNKASARYINHVGMVVEAKGDGTFSFIHAASQGIIISYSTEPFWTARYVGARRIIGS